MDSCLSDIWLHKDIDLFAQLLNLILTENVSGKFHVLLHKKKQPQIYLDFYGYFYLQFQMVLPLHSDADWKNDRASRNNGLFS